MTVKKIVQQQHRQHQEQQALLKYLLPCIIITKMNRSEMGIERLSAIRSNLIEHKNVDQNGIEHNNTKMFRIK